MMAGVAVDNGSENRAAGSLTAGISQKQEGELQPDVLTPEQFYRLSRPSTLPGHKRLLEAVLKTAIEDYQRYGGVESARAREHFEEAKAYILSDDAEWTFSFRNACEALDIDAEYLRGGILRGAVSKVSRRQTGRR